MTSCLFKMAYEKKSASFYNRHKYNEVLKIVVLYVIKRIYLKRYIIND